ncbi:hypothetical protein G5V58_11750 [Nocardioides anomalus]|uniref:Uncharacterized protein n=1 Tax=Nocardioides anomalus TaxID=2712223 RepID=A0A6G6WDQ8_9ACTN|nr:hypothetical protein [Nocardioides anomalus]QIG43349.1 hypothetical protein G5V58_11750 [Nocardioides anomalus]
MSAADTGAEPLAVALWEQARDHEQAVRRVPDDDVARDVRARVRALAAGSGVRIRTARIDDTVVVVRLDAAVWDDDTATMRRKLGLPADGAAPDLG